MKRHLVSICSTILVLLSILFLLAPVVTFENGPDVQTTGLHIIFGQTADLLGDANTVYLSFSVVPFVALVLLVVGILLTWLGFIPFNRVLAFACLVAGGILICFFPNFAVRGYEGISNNVVTGLPVLYLAGASSILAGLIVLAKPMFTKRELE